MKPQIEITVDELGNTEIEAIGCPGPSCQSLTEAFEKALGTKTADRKNPEFYGRQNQGQQAKAGQ